MKIDPDIFPLQQKDIAAEVTDSRTYLRFPLVKGEQNYGFGLSFKTVHHRVKNSSFMSIIMEEPITAAHMRLSPFMFRIEVMVSE